jgi:hypothetical protein
MRQQNVKNKSMMLLALRCCIYFYCRFMVEKLCYDIKDRLAKSHTAAAKEI